MTLSYPSARTPRDLCELGLVGIENDIRDPEGVKSNETVRCGELGVAVRSEPPRAGERASVRTRPENFTQPLWIDDVEVF